MGMQLDQRQMVFGNPILENTGRDEQTPQG